MKTNLSIVLILLLAVQLGIAKTPKLSISFEKKVNVFTVGEPMIINCKFENRTSDTLEFEHSFGLASWEIYKVWKRMPTISARALESYEERIYPEENRRFLHDPTASRQFDAGIYFIRAFMSDKKGDIYKSNRISFIVKKGNRSAAKVAKECYNGKTNEIQIQRSLDFIEKYKKSHLRDDIVFHVAKIFEKERRYEKAIEVLKEFEQTDFETSIRQRNGAFSRIARNYKTLGEYDKAMSYYKKSTYRYSPEKHYKTSIDRKIFYLQRTIDEKKKQPYWISIEKSRFEMGEPIKINSEFRNLTSDTLHFLEPNVNTVSWEISKDREEIKPITIICGSLIDSPIISLQPNGSKKISGAPTDKYMLNPGSYSVNRILSDTSGKIYRSNKLSFKIREPKEEMLNDLKDVRNAGSLKQIIKTGTHFLEKYKQSHLRDEVILETGFALSKDGQYQKAISLFKEFDNPEFSTTQNERNKAFGRISSIYKQLKEYEKAISYLKKITPPNLFNKSDIEEIMLKIKNQ